MNDNMTMTPYNKAFDAMVAVGWIEIGIIIIIRSAPPCIDAAVMMIDVFVKVYIHRSVPS